MNGYDYTSAMTMWAAFMPLIIIAAIWSSVWKGFALYRAGKVQDPVWFVVLFLVNTLGILEILYLFVFSKRTSRTQPRA